MASSYIGILARYLVKKGRSTNEPVVHTEEANAMMRLTFTVIAGFFYPLRHMPNQMPTRSIYRS